MYHSSRFQEKDLGDDASLRSIDIKEELRKMTLDMVKVTGLLGAVARLKNHTCHKLYFLTTGSFEAFDQMLNPGQRSKKRLSASPQWMFT